MIEILIGAIASGLASVLDYLSAHVLTCLVPAFFIAGAIAAFVRKDAILKYFSPGTKKPVSYGIASVSGTILAVCSCTILPIYAGILKKGSGIGPATTFLFSGPAINILAIIYTARVLGFDLGAARAVSAVVLAIAIGLAMAAIFRASDIETLRQQAMAPSVAGACEEEKPRWVTPAFFALMIGVLVFGASQLAWAIRLGIVYILTVAIAVLLIYYYDRDEVTDWGLETWDLTKKIFPILIAGTFLVGIIAFFLPPETFQPFFGNNTLAANFFAAIVGMILYMPTLLEVPIIGTTFGYSAGHMAAGPALALLLAGPTVSLPSVLVIYRIVGARKTAAYVALVVAFATTAGFLYGNGMLIL
ncbi:transporter [hydrocarbon metagenome]|uniref:Transporter n=1 Tax=hydrocarbon metagenome TaxID=938273 RepID=A0A0W8FIT5_9ZZZZ|nr:permease [Methanomicrobiaceae archaeon]